MHTGILLVYTHLCYLCYKLYIMYINKQSCYVQSWLCYCLCVYSCLTTSVTRDGDSEMKSWEYKNNNWSMDVGILEHPSVQSCLPCCDFATHVQLSIGNFRCVLLYNHSAASWYANLDHFQTISALDRELAGTSSSLRGFGSLYTWLKLWNFTARNQIIAI
jgi:hypothetical protein